MTAAERPLRHPTLAFLAGAAAIYALGAIVVRALPGFDHPERIAAALAFDLTVTVTLLAWLFPVRSGRWPLASLVPLFALSTAAATRVLPAESGAVLDPMRILAAGAELALAGWIATRVIRFASRRGPADPSLDLLARARRAAAEIAGRNVAAEVLAFEVAALGYAFGPRRKPHVPAGSSAFASGQRNAYGAVIAAFALVVVAETVPLHLLLSRWSAPAAWTFTALGLYTLLYLLADWRAVRLRPHLLDADALVVRTGIRWTVRVPRDRIAAVERRPPRSGEKPLWAALSGDANLWLQLSDPVTADGVYGRKREVKRIALTADEPDRLAEALRVR